MLESFVKKIKTNILKKASNGVELPFERNDDELRKSILNKLSKHALDLYIKKTDINNFTKLALSNPEDKSHNELVKNLMSEHDFIDPFDSLHIGDLAQNENFLKDLGL